MYTLNLRGIIVNFPSFCPLVQCQREKEREGKEKCTPTRRVFNKSIRELKEEGKRFFYSKLRLNKLYIRERERVLTLIHVYKRREKKKATNYTRSFGRDELLGSFSLTSRPKAIPPHRSSVKMAVVFFFSLSFFYSFKMQEEV